MESSTSSKLKRFFRFVEIETKLATMIPSLAALAYVFYTTGTINFSSMGIYFIAALFLDMSVTAINNHLDKREDESQTPHYSKLTSLAIIGAMLLVFSALGLYLAYLHGVTVLLAGVFCLFVGVAYTFGPAPISKSAYGELVSGFTVGSVVMFIVVSINNPDFQPLGLVFYMSELRLAMDIDLVGLAAFALVTLPAAFSTANIMLANNICDEERDRPFRYTIVHHLGKKRALYLFAGLYYGVYLAVVMASILRIVPLWCLLVLGTLPLVQRNIRSFFAEQKKNTTFLLAIKNFVIIMLAYILGIVLGGVI